MNVMIPKCHPATILLVGILLLLAADSCQAQRDIRQSPDWLAFQTPNDIQIQAGASIDTRSIVVWGTMLPTSGGTSYGALVAQALEGITPVGSPIEITDKTAVPNGLIIVRAIGDRFLALWNDKQGGGPVIRSCVLGRDARRVGSIRSVANGRIVADSLAWMIAGEGTHLFLWCDDTHGSETFCATIDENLELGTVQRVDSGQIRLGLIDRFFPDLLVLDRIGREPLVIRADRAIVNRSGSVGSRLLAPHCRRDDSSFAALIGGTVQLFISLFDSIPMHTVSPPHFEEVVPKFGVVQPESGGGFRIVAVLDATQRVPIAGDDASSFIVCRVEIDRDGNLQSITDLDTAYWWTADMGNIWWGYSWSGTVTNSWCDGSFSASMRESYGLHYPGTQITRWFILTYYVAISAAGELIADGISELSADFPAPVPVRPYCTDVVRVERLRADSISSVRAYIDTVFVDLDVPVSPTLLHASDGMPHVFLRDGEPIVTWLHSSNPGWLIRHSWAEHDAPPLWTAQIDTPSYAVGPGVSLTRCDGGEIGSLLQQSYHISPVTREIDRRYWLFKLYLPTSEGFVQFYQDSGSAEHTARTFTTDAMATNADRSAFAIAFSASGSEGTHRWVIAVDTGGTVLWSDSIPSPASAPEAMALLGPRHILMINRDTVREFRDGIVVRESRLDIGSSGPPPQLTVLSDGTLLYLRWLDLGAVCEIRHYSQGLDYQISQPVSIDNPFAQLPCIANYGTKGFAVLLGGSGGPRALFFDYNLSARDPAGSGRAPVRIGGNGDSVGFVSGCFNGDTLYAAWEDRRWGVADIYGARWYSRAWRDGVESRLEKNSSDSLNLVLLDRGPGRFTVELRSMLPGDATVLLVDQLGAIVLRREIAADESMGDRRFTIDDLPSGVYGLVAVASGRRITKMVSVIR